MQELMETPALMSMAS